MHMKQLYISFIAILFAAFPVSLLAQNVGVNTTSPAESLSVNGGVSVGSNYASTQTAPTDGIAVEGGVGIGTPTLSNHGVLLRVLDDVSIGGGSADHDGSAEFIRFNTQSDELWMGVRNDATVAGSRFFISTSEDAAGDEMFNIRPSDGYVGIGVSNATSLLHLSGTNVSQEPDMRIDNVSAQILLGGGEVGPHGISFGDNGTEGLQLLYRSSPNLLVVEKGNDFADNDDLFSIDYDTEYGYFKGRVGIGESNPGAELEVVGKTLTDQLQVTTGAVNGYIFVSDANGNAIWTDPTTITTADDGDWVKVGADIERQSGDVYIGNSNTTNNALYISADIIDWDDTDYFLDPNSISQVNEISADGGSATDVGFYFDHDQNTGLFQPAADVIAVSTNGSETFRIHSNGNVGIGVTDPDYLVEMDGDVFLRNDAQIIFSTGSSSEDIAIKSTGEDLYISEPEDGDFIFLYIDDNGAGQGSVQMRSGLETKKRYSYFRRHIRHDGGGTSDGVDMGNWDFCTLQGMKNSFDDDSFDQGGSDYSWDMVRYYCDVSIGNLTDYVNTDSDASTSNYDYDYDSRPAWRLEAYMRSPEDQSIVVCSAMCINFDY